MSEQLTHALGALTRIGKLIDDIIEQTADPGQRGERLSAMLRTLWPICGLSACLLRLHCDSYASVLDVSGTSRTEWADALWELLNANGERPTILPAAIALPDHGLAIEWIGLEQHRVGMVALAVPASLEPDIRAVLDAGLSLCSAQLAWHLLAESQERVCRRLLDQVADLDWLASVGEMVGPIIHEFNNFLNVSLLHATILERHLGEAFRADMTSLRKQGADTAALVKRLQQYRQHSRPNPRTVNLNRLIGEVLDWDGSRPFVRLAVESGEARVSFEPAAELRPVLGNDADLKRLLRFLLANSAAASGGTTEVRIRTGHSNGQVWLRLEDCGPIVATEMLPHLFDSLNDCRPGVDSLELAACKALVRRLQGKIRAENISGQGLAFVIELPASDVS